MIRSKIHVQGEKEAAKEARMHRRRFITLLGCTSGYLFIAGAARSLGAQETHSAKIREVGFFYPGTVEASRLRIAAFLQGLQEKGYVEGQNVALVTRITELRPERLAPLALELVHRKVDVILGIGSPAVLAARAATSSIPIVALDLESDPVNRGFVSSLSRPGGNITGLFFDFPEFSGKWFELLEEVLPGLAHVTILWDPATDTPQLGGVNAVATARHIALELLTVETLAQMEDAFRAAAENQTQAVMLLSSPLFGANLKLAASLALQYRLPAITMFPEFAEVGGLMGYGTDLMHLYQQAGALVGKILSGARPADIPVERPMRFQFVINLKTAKALGLTVPPTLLIRADEVIEDLG
jgi:putative ABC transport system substrate-binding protein